MASGCLILGSATPPVLEVLRDGTNGLTVDFFSHKELAQRIEDALDRRRDMEPLRQAARATAVEQFDLNRVLLPRWTALFDDLMHGRRPTEALPVQPARGLPPRRVSARVFRRTT
jgi:glycosyltransferase involved in cell wall biosynthesis